MIKTNTFGNTKGALKLVEIINERNLDHNKIGRLITTFNLTLNELSKIDTRVGVGLAKLVFKQYTEKVVELESEVQTYVQNVISSKFKNWMVQEHGHKPYKVRKNK